jgi:hypothetical protein
MRTITPAVLLLAMDQTHKRACPTSNHVTTALSQVAVARHVSCSQVRAPARDTIGTRAAPGCGMSILKLGGLLFAISLCGCLDDPDVEPLPPEEIDSEYDTDLDEDADDNPVPSDDTCSERRKADGPCAP